MMLDVGDVSEDGFQWWFNDKFWWLFLVVSLAVGMGSEKFL